MRVNIRKGRKGLKCYKIRSVTYFNSSIGEILVCLYSLYQPPEFPSTMSCLATPARASHVHVNTWFLKLQLFLDSPSGFCLHYHLQNPSRLSLGEKPESIWKSFYGPFKLALNIASIKEPFTFGKEYGIEELGRKTEIYFMQLWSRSLLVNSWAHHPDQCLTKIRGNAFVKVWVRCRVVYLSHQWLNVVVCAGEKR